MEILQNHIAYLRSHLDSFQHIEQLELKKKQQQKNPVNM